MMHLQLTNAFLSESIGELTEARAKTLKKDMRLKNGDVIPKGTKVTVEFLGERHPKGLSTALIKTAWKGPSGRDYMSDSIKIAISRLHVSVTGFSKPPGMARIRKMDSEGVATTPTGKRTEPDGYGPDGSPSWMLVLGLI